MAGYYDKVAPNDNIWAGMANEQVNGDDLLNQVNPRIRYLSPYQRKIQLVQQAAQQAAAANGTGTLPVNTTTTAATFDPVQFVKDNWLILGVAGVALFFMFGNSGGGLAERSVVTRYKK